MVIHFLKNMEEESGWLVLSRGQALESRGIIEFEGREVK